MQNATLNGTRTPDTTQDPWHPRATTTGAPLLQGDALVAYENLKREKNCKGMESECESMSEMDVVDVCICVSSDCEMGTNWPQWH